MQAAAKVIMMTPMIAAVSAWINLQTFVMFLATFLLLSFFLRSRDTRNLPPGPQSLPVVGTMLTFAIKARQYTSPFRVVQAWREDYGDIFRMKFGPQEAVVISGYKLVTEALQKHKHVFSSRPHVHTFEALTGGYGVILSNGRMWQETRKFTSGALRKMGVGKTSLEVHLQEETRFLIDSMEVEERPFNPRNILMKAATNIILRICFGERCNYEDREFCELIKNLDIFIDTFGIQMLENFWPWIEHIPPLAKLPSLRAANEGVEKFVRQRVFEHNESFECEHVRDFTDLFIIQRHTWADKVMNTDRHMCQTVMDLIEAGTATSAANLSWLLLHMIRNPDIQEKCREEIMKVVGNGRMVSLSDRSQLVYNLAVMNEVQRHCTIVPLGLPRGVSNDIEIGGYLVPKNTMAIFDLDSVHRDQTQWGPDADEFESERWIDEHGQLRTYDAFMPFSTGNRQCIGEQLARMEDFLFFTNAIQRLSFKVPEETLKIEMDGIQPSLLQIPQDFNLVAETLH